MSADQDCVRAPCSMAQAPRAQMDLAPEGLGQQLSALLGRRGPHDIRKTDENPPRISIIDVAVLITGKAARHAAEAIRNTCQSYPEVADRIGHIKFPGRAQKKTPVADVSGIVASRARNIHQRILFIVVLFGGAVCRCLFPSPRRS